MGLRQVLFGLLCLLSSVNLSSCGSSSNPAAASSSGPSGPAVLYILNNDTTSSGNFQSFLNGHGYNCKVVTYSAAVSETMANYSIILIGQDTYSGGSWLGSAGLVNLIKNSNKPVVGIGYGGANFFDAAGYSGIVALASTSGDPVSLVNGSIDVANAYWQTPNAVTSSANVTLYSTGISCIEWHYSSAPAHCKLLGAEPANAGNYSLLDEDTGHTVYFEWGYTYDPTVMTSTGQNLFLNVMSHIQVYPPLLINYPTAGTGGNGFSDGLDIVTYPGTTLSSIVLWISSNTAGAYTYTLTAHDSCFAGTLIGNSTSPSVTQDGNVNHNMPVTFTFAGSPAVTLGHTVAMDLVEASGPAGSNFFCTAGNYSGLTNSSIGVNDLTDTTGCVSSVRTYGFAILVYGNP